MVNQQSPKSGDSVHKTCNGSTPDPYFSPPPYQKKNKRSGYARLIKIIVFNFMHSMIIIIVHLHKSVEGALVKIFFFHRGIN